MSAPSLATLGWNAARELAFEPFRAAGSLPGRVCLEHNHVFRVFTEEGEQLAETTGRLRHRAGGRNELPVVGDWVALRPDPGGRWQIRDVLPRQSAFSRKAAGRETEEQVLAANIDAILIVFGLDTHVKPRAIERYLVVARQSGAEVMVILSKSDVIDDPEALAEDIELAQAASGGAPVHAVSTRSGAGFEFIDEVCAPGKTVTFIGPSGVGKSSIVNRIIGREELATGEVREWDSRGRHTSVHRQLLIREAGGIVIDTPGMRELQLWEIEAVAGGFADVESIAGACRFRDCRHQTEPGCAVKIAVEQGTLDGDRFESFQKLLVEQEAIEKKRDERALADAKRAAKQMGRAVRSMYQERDRRGHR